MLKLVHNEWSKILRQTSTWVMLMILFLGVLGYGALAKYLESKVEPVNTNWKEELVEQNASFKQNLEEVQVVTPSYREFSEKQIAINEYRIEHNLPPETNYVVWNFINESGILIDLVGLFVIIIAAGIVAHEFSWGTIKMLLVKPYSRWKVLLSKYIAVNLCLLVGIAFLFVVSFIVGAILFGFGEDASNIHLAFVNGTVEEQNMVFYLMKVYLLSSLSVFLLAAMAFMISTVFRNSGIAIGISIFLLMTGGTVTNLLASKFEWAKYSLFANTNLMQYFDGQPLVEGMTLSFSIVMIIVYFAIFHLLSFTFFTKRDIAS